MKKNQDCSFLRRILQLMLVAIFCLPLALSAQVDLTLWRTYNDPAPGVTFDDLQESFDTYWDGREYEKGKGKKQFQRWAAYKKPRIYPSNDLNLTQHTAKNYKAWLRFHPVLEEMRNYGPQWTSLGPHGRATGFDSGNGRVNMLRVNPLDTNTLYVGTPDGGLWKSSNGGENWTTNTDFLSSIGVADLVIHPTDTNIMYLATGDVEGDKISAGIMKSTDAGKTWELTGLFWQASEQQRARKLLMDPGNPDVMLIATNNGVYRTTDGWATFTTSGPLGITLQDLEFKPGDSDIVYASGTKFYKSTDNGVSFTEITSGLPSSDVVRMVIAVSPADSTVVYAFCGSESNSGFLGMYRSTNSGTSFSVQSTTPNVLGFEVNGMDVGGQAFYDMALCVSPADASIVTVGGINQWQSDDGGVNWYMISHWFGEMGFPYIHADVHEVVHLESNPNTMFTSCDGGIYRSRDYGYNWTDISNNLAISQQNAVGHSATNKDRIFSGLQDIGTIETDDATIPDSAWHISTGGGGDGEDCFIDRNNDNNIIVSSQDGGHDLSTDGGTTFNRISNDIKKGEFYSAIRQHPLLDASYLVGGRDSFYRTDNMGTNWYVLSVPFVGDYTSEFYVAPSDTSIIYVTNTLLLLKSTDSGYSWTDVTGTLPTDKASISKITVSNTDADKVWVTFSGYSDTTKVFKSTDGATSWTNISAGLPNIPINTIVYQDDSANDNVYIGADLGVYFRNNTISDWIPHSNSLPHAQVKDLRIFYNSTPPRLRAATYGRGAWESDVITNPCVLSIVSNCPDGPCLLDNGLHQAQDFIQYTGEHLILSNSEVTFSAKDSISLANGFEVLLGGQFIINTTGCTN